MLRTARMSQTYKLMLATAGLLVGLVASTAQAADPWPSDGQNPYNHRYGGNAGPTGSRAYNLTKVWSRSFDSPVVGTPIIADNGGIYVATQNGEVTALRYNDGVKYWGQYIGDRTMGRIEGSVLRRGDIYAVVTTSTGPKLTALDALTGNIKWQAGLGETSRDADACGGPQFSARYNLIIVGLGACKAEREGDKPSVRGAVVAVDATTGMLRWRTSTITTPFATGGGVNSPPIVWDDGNKVFVTTGHAYQSGSLEPYTDSFLRLDLATGAIDAKLQVNQGDTSDNSVQNSVTKRLGFSSPPIAFSIRGVGSYLGAGAEDGKYYIVDPMTMEFMSSTQLTLGEGPAGISAASAFDNTRNAPKRIVTVTSSPSAFFGLDPDAGGTISWAFPGTDVAHRGPISIADNAVWSTSTTGFVDIQYRLDGHLLGRYPLGIPSVGGVSFYKDVAYVAAGAPAGTIPGNPSTGGAVFALK